MQTAAVNLDAQNFFQANVAEMNFPSEMVEECKLARFIRRFENHSLEAKGFCEAIGVRGVEVSLIVKEPDSPGAFPRFHHKLQSSCVQPSLALLNQFADDGLGKGTRMLLPYFELHLRPTLLTQLDDVERRD